MTDIKLSLLFTLRSIQLYEKPFSTGSHTRHQTHKGEFCFAKPSYERPVKRGFCFAKSSMSDPLLKAAVLQFQRLMGTIS